jgi:hypothetical protein
VDQRRTQGNYLDLQKKAERTGEKKLIYSMGQLASDKPKRRIGNKKVSNLPYGLTSGELKAVQGLIKYGAIARSPT